MSLVHVGIRPHDLGVLVLRPDGRAYRPEWRLVSDLQVNLDNPGLPEYWCTDRHRVYFDKPAIRDIEIHVSEGQDMTTRMMHPLHGWMHAYSASEIEALKKHGWVVEEQPKPKESPPKKRGRPAKAK